MIWPLVWSARSQKDLKALHPTTARGIQRTLDRFSQTGQADIRPLLNVTPETWRIRSGQHRVLVHLRENSKEAYIVRIRPRGSAY